METKGDEEGNCNAIMTLPKLTEASDESVSKCLTSWPIFKSDTW
jgi:hypothetical protein